MWMSWIQYEESSERMFFKSKLQWIFRNLICEQKKNWFISWSDGIRGTSTKEMVVYTLYNGLLFKGCGRVQFRMNKVYCIVALEQIVQGN